MPKCNTLKKGDLPERRCWPFTGGWVSYCWVPKRDDAENAENEKNDYKVDQGNRKNKYKCIIWCNLIYKKFFFLKEKLIKSSYKLLIISLVLCSDTFFIKLLVSKKLKKKKKVIIIIIKNKKERKKCLIRFIR